MKKYVVLIVCLALALSVSVCAVSYDAYYYQNEDGTYGHDTEAYKHDLAQEMLNERGLSLNLDVYWVADPSASELTYVFDFGAFQNDYNALVEALPPVSVEPPTEPVTETLVESVETTEEEVIEEVIEDEPVVEEEEPLEAVEEIESTDSTAPMTYSVVDMRAETFATGEESENTSALKNLVVTLFGAYQPITTTTTVTETVDGETITTLLDAVADGVAGVDFEWVAGVVIFCIVLFSFFRIVGVVFKR